MRGGTPDSLSRAGNTSARSRREPIKKACTADPWRPLVLRLPIVRDNPMNPCYRAQRPLEDSLKD